MYIMVNREPLNLERIQEISPVITLDSKTYYNELITTAFNDSYIGSIKMPKEFLKLSASDILKDIDNGNTVWGYFFLIKYSEYQQIYISEKANTINVHIRKIPSRLYATKQQAQTALEHLLSEINKVYNKLVKVEI